MNRQEYRGFCAYVMNEADKLSPLATLNRRALLLLVSQSLRTSSERLQGSIQFIDYFDSCHLISNPARKQFSESFA